MATIKDIQKLFKRAINPKSFVILITSTAIVTVAVAREKPNFELESNSSLQENLELPKNFFVYGVTTDSIYTQTLPYPIDDSGSVAVEIDLIVNSPQPAVLLLEGDNVAVWNIHWTEKTNILGAIVFSDYTQGVAGLPKEIPVSIDPLAKYKSDSCFHNTSNEKCNLEQISQKFFGRSLQEKSLIYSQGGYILGEPVEENSVLLTSNDTPVNSFFLLV